LAEHRVQNAEFEILDDRVFLESTRVEGSAIGGGGGGGNRNDKRDGENHCFPRGNGSRKHITWQKKTVAI